MYIYIYNPPMTLAEGAPGTWGNQVCTAASVVFFFTPTGCPLCVPPGVRNQWRWLCGAGWGRIFMNLHAWSLALSWHVTLACRAVCRGHSNSLLRSCLPFEFAAWVPTLVPDWPDPCWSGRTHPFGFTVVFARCSLARD